MNENLKDLILSGQKTATTRLGIKDYAVGPAVIVFNDSKLELPVNITSITKIKFQDIDHILATRENHTVESLKSVLKAIYGPIEDNQVMTVISFEMV